MNHISAQELKSKIDQNADIEIIDVREIHEYEDRNINGKHIPLATVLDNLDQIDLSKQVVFCCQSGKRSKAIVVALSKKIDCENLYTLDGGINGYFEAIG